MFINIYMPIYYIGVDKMTIKKNDWVAVQYTGKIAATGEVFDTNKERDLLKFKVGSGMVIPGFDNALIDMEVEQEKEVKIPSNLAYGERNTRVVELPKSSFQDTEKLEQGKEVVVNTNFGPMMLDVKEIKDQTISVILNHPLAGKDLLFNIKLVRILDEKEIQEIEQKLKQNACGPDCSSCGDTCSSK